MIPKMEQQPPRRCEHCDYTCMLENTMICHLYIVHQDNRIPHGWHPEEYKFVYQEEIRYNMMTAGITARPEEYQHSNDGTPKRSPTK